MLWNHRTNAFTEHAEHVDHPLVDPATVEIEIFKVNFFFV